ncbi:FG-GAP repeat domain-containing protein [Streptomyces sp. AA1529]|uniref:FG-GAP repeat domain-containing protein n=1 Tax=Streptomyces sp. AA1529 TaxID=1203257 RepID=UPI003D704E11
MAALMGASPPAASSASASASASDVSDRKAPASRHTPEETRALTQAADSGEPVELRSKRTEYTKLFANPEGDFTQDTYALPQSVQRGGALVDIDTGLKKNEDGTYSPSATETGMKFSGGGDAPLATVTRDGRSLSLTWPSGKLPTPQVHGDSVTYPEVLEGVDLTLRAHSTGFGQLLKVKNKEAAQSTELQQLDFKLSTQGLKVDADEHGNLRARNPVGQEVFTAPTPRMWDSSTDETEAPPKVARSAGPTTESTTGDSSGLSDDGIEPKPGARDATMDVAVKGDILSLTPDSDVLTGKETTYPVYLDPSVSGSRYSWTIAYKKYPNSSYYNGSGFNGGTTTARAGYENYTNGLGRSYFRMNTKNLWSTDKIVSKSTFRIKNTWSWSCSKRKIELWRTAPIGPGTTWNKQPTKRETLDSVTDAKGWGSDCPAGNLAFDTTKAAKDAAANHWKTVTLGLKATNESSVYGWKKFAAKSAVLSTTYNTRPNTPSGLDTSPVSTRNSDGCGDTAPHGAIGNTDFFLGAKVKDRDGGTVKAIFHLWPTGHRYEDDGGLIIDKTVSVPSGTVARAKVTRADLKPYLDVANGNFSWKVRAYDGRAYSGWNTPKGDPGCRFVLDPDRPSTPPGVSSSTFPDGSDGWPATTGEVRTEGPFTLSAGGVDDVTAYEHWTDSKPDPVKVDAPSAGADATVELTPTWAGPQHLYVRSIDKAGNRSDTRTYLYYANGLAEPDKPGDINGDGNADLWGIDKDGTLHRWQGQGDGTLKDHARAASDTTWNDARITHRGDWTGDGYEDLIALRPDGPDGEHRLWLHPNNGFGFACTACRTGDYQRSEMTVQDPANNHWEEGAKQILAIGDMDGALDLDGDGEPDTDSNPDLIVNDGTNIWLYYGSSDGYLDTVREPVLIGDTGADNVTLAAPGDFNDDGRVDLLARFENSGGNLYIYDGGQPDGIGIGNPDHRTRIGWNWGTDTVPKFTAAPDADNNGKLDLWTTTPGNGQLRLFANHTADGPENITTISDAFAGYRSLG